GADKDCALETPSLAFRNEPLAQCRQICERYELIRGNVNDGGHIHRLSAWIAAPKSGSSFRGGRRTYLFEEYFATGCRLSLVANGEEPGRDLFCWKVSTDLAIDHGRWHRLPLPGIYGCV